MDDKYLHDAGVELMRMVKATLHAYRRFSKAAIEEEHISVCGLQILDALRYYPDNNTVSDLAENLEVSKGLISREVEVLRKNGYVTTAVDAKDRRVLRIKINREESDEILVKEKKMLFSLIYQMAGDLSDEEIVTYKDLNKRVYGNLMKAEIDKEIPHIKEIDVTKFMF
ncbi:MAG: MarR family winged helix-turn-helix transcriptional regulator [Ruminococcus sp.]